MVVLFWDILSSRSGYRVENVKKRISFIGSLGLRATLPSVALPCRVSRYLAECHVPIATLLIGALLTI